MAAYLIVWRYEVDGARREEFEQAYGPTGPWSELFGRTAGYLGTELVRLDEAGAYLTLDRWTSYRGGLFDNRPTSAYPEIEPHGNPGFSIRHAANVVLRRCSVAWGNNRPDYFTHALEAEDVIGLGLTQFAGEAAHPDRDEAVVIRSCV